jgi:hypothetical protein
VFASSRTDGRNASGRWIRFFPRPVIFGPIWTAVVQMRRAAGNALRSKFWRGNLSFIELKALPPSERHLNLANTARLQLQCISASQLECFSNYNQH